MNEYNYVPADGFDPENNRHVPAHERTWQPVGRVKNVIPPGSNTERNTVERFTLEMASGHRIILSILSPLTFRVRFSPDPNAQFEMTRSPATIKDRIDITDIEHNAGDINAEELRIFTGQLRFVSIRVIMLYQCIGGKVHS